MLDSQFLDLHISNDLLPSTLIIHIDDHSTMSYCCTSNQNKHIGVDDPWHCCFLWPKAPFLTFLLFTLTGLLMIPSLQLWLWKTKKPQIYLKLLWLWHLCALPIQINIFMTMLAFELLYWQKISKYSFLHYVIISTPILEVKQLRVIENERLT